MPDIPMQPDSANIFVKTVYYGAGLFMQSSLAKRHLKTVLENTFYKDRFEKMVIGKERS